MSSPQPSSSGAAVTLGVATPLNSTPQEIQDQNGNGSSLGIGTNSVEIAAKADFNIDGSVPAGRFTVTSGGNVGINQANPQFALDVNGEIHSTGGLLVIGLATVSQAPNGENLCSLFYDPTNGGFYYQS